MYYIGKNLNNYIKQLKIQHIMILFCIFLPFFFCSCSNGKLHEGKCVCKITFEDIPKEFNQIEENLLSQFAIHCTLTNITTEKKYYITLNQENDYAMEVSLNPGTYEIFSYTDMGEYTGIAVTANAKSITLSKKKESKINFTVKNPEKLTKVLKSVKPLPDILSADKFSRKIQIDGKIISIKDILSYLEITSTVNSLSEHNIIEEAISEDLTVNEYDKLYVKDNKHGIIVILQNKKDKEVSYKKCDVIGIKLCKNRAVFPGGVTIGMSPSAVCHKKDGIYGKADKFGGGLLHGWDYTGTKAIYSDSKRGDRLTVETDSNGMYIQSILYEFELFE